MPEGTRFGSLSVTYLLDPQWNRESELGQSLATDLPGWRIFTVNYPSRMLFYIANARRAKDAKRAADAAIARAAAAALDAHKTTTPKKLTVTVARV